MSRKTSGSKKIGLKSQVLLTMGSILFLFALVLGFFFYAAAIMPGQKTVSAKPDSANTQSILQLQSTLAETQQISNMFFLTGDSALADKHKAEATKLVYQTKKFQQTATKSGNKKDATFAGQINSQAQSYSNLFQQLAQAHLAQGNDLNNGLRGQLNTAAQTFYAIIDRNDVNSLALAVIELQVQQEDYLRTNRSASLQNLLHAKKKLERVARETKIDMLEAQLLRKSIRNYSSALDRYQAVSLATNDPNLSSTLGKEQSRQADAVRSGAGEIQGVVARVNVPSAATLSSAIRKSETDFMLYGEEQNITAVNKYLDELSKAYNTSSILQKHKEELIKASAAYRGAFNSLADNQKKTKDLTAKFNKAASSLSASIAAQAKSKGSRNASREMSITRDNNLFILIACIAGLVVILIGLIAAMRLGKSIATPIASITQILQRIIRDQDFSVEIPVTTKNEIGDLAEELNNLLDLQDEIAYQSLDETDSLSAHLKKIYELGAAVKGSINELCENTNKINQIAVEHEDIGTAADNSINQITAAANTITKTEDQAPDSDLDEPFTEVAEKINQSLESALKGIQDITEGSSQISDIISQSGDIAEQTNLLALNASVKAARAGSHGKEFSTIADDIAKLAQRSEELSKEAKELSQTLSDNISQSVSQGDDVKIELEKVEKISQPVQPSAVDHASQVETILQGTDELGQMISKFATAIQEIVSIAREQVEECETVQSTADQLLEITSDMSEPSDQGSEDNALVTEEEQTGNIQISPDEEKENWDVDEQEIPEDQEAQDTK